MLFRSAGCCCSRGGWALRRTSVLARLARSGADARPRKKRSPAGPPNQDARRCEPKDNPHSPPPCLLSSRRPRVSARDITLLYSSRYAHPPPAFQPPFVKGEVLRPSEQIAFSASQNTRGDVRRDRRMPPFSAGAPNATNTLFRSTQRRTRKLGGAVCT